MTAPGLLPDPGTTDRDWLAALVAAFPPQDAARARQQLTDLVRAVLTDHDLGWLTVDAVDGVGRWILPALQVHVTSDQPRVSLDVTVEDGQVHLRGRADGQLWDTVEAAGHDLAGRVGPDHTLPLLRLRAERTADLLARSLHPEPGEEVLADLLAEDLDERSGPGLLDSGAQELLVMALARDGHPAASTADTLMSDWDGTARELADTLARLVPGP